MDLGCSNGDNKPLCVKLPPGPVTPRGTVPLPAGATAVMLLWLFTVNEVAAADPKLTAVAPVKSAPVKVTIVPPTGPPVVG